MGAVAILFVDIPAYHEEAGLMEKSEEVSHIWAAKRRG